MEDTKMRMLRWMCGQKSMDQIRNQAFREKLGVALIFAKIHENKFRWFGHV